MENLWKAVVGWTTATSLGKYERLIESLPRDICEYLKKVVQ